MDSIKHLIGISGERFHSCMHGKPRDTVYLGLVYRGNYTSSHLIMPECSTSFPL